RQCRSAAAQPDRLISRHRESALPLAIHQFGTDRDSRSFGTNVRPPASLFGRSAFAASEASLRQHAVRRRTRGETVVDAFSVVPLLRAMEFRIRAFETDGFARG